MEPVPDLKKIEQKTWRVMFEDGLLDMLWGLMLMQMLFAYFLNLVGVPHPYNYFPIMVVSLVAMIFGKLFITKPRLGNVKFSTRRNIRRGIAKLVALIMAGVGIVIAVAFGSKALTSSDFDLFGPASGSLLILLATVLVPLIILSWLLNFWRMAVYGVVLIAADQLGEALKASWGTPYDLIFAFALPGLVIFIFGAVLLARFLRKYPRLQEGSEHE